MPSEVQVIDNCVRLLEQASAVIERIGDSIYVTTLPLSPRGSIGGHMRHILDFYQSFLSGLEIGRVNYNSRQRHSLIERDRCEALKRIGDIILALQSLSSLDSKAGLLVSTEACSAVGPAWGSSSVLRELDFLQSHTVHHFSLVAMLLRMNRIEPGEEFGVATSTLNYWREERAGCAK